MKMLDLFDSISETFKISSFRSARVLYDYQKGEKSYYLFIFKLIFILYR